MMFWELIVSVLLADCGVLLADCVVGCGVLLAASGVLGAIDPIWGGHTSPHHSLPLPFPTHPILPTILSSTSVPSLLPYATCLFITYISHYLFLFITCYRSFRYYKNLHRFDLA